MSNQKHPKCILSEICVLSALVPPLMPPIAARRAGHVGAAPAPSPPPHLAAIPPARHTPTVALAVCQRSEAHFRRSPPAFRSLSQCETSPNCRASWTVHPPDDMSGRRKKGIVKRITLGKVAAPIYPKRRCAPVCGGGRGPPKWGTKSADATSVCPVF